MSDDLEAMTARAQKEKAPEGDWLAPQFDPESVLRENEERRQQREERYAQMEREHLVQLRGDDGMDPALLYLPKIETESEEEDQEPDDSSSLEMTVTKMAVSPSLRRHHHRPGRKA